MFVLHSSTKRSRKWKESDDGARALCVVAWYGGIMRVVGDGWWPYQEMEFETSLLNFKSVCGDAMSCWSTVKQRRADPRPCKSSAAVHLGHSRVVQHAKMVLHAL